MGDDKKISVIVTVFRTEQYLNKCLSSLINQTYHNLEIIVVDDGSDGDVRGIVSALQDGRIKYIRHAENKGLFAARMTGIRMANGEFIGFVDSDDYISCDYYRLLLNQMLIKNADIVVGRTVLESNSGYTSILTLHDAALSVLPLVGKEIQNTFFNQQGACFAWHTVWNKLYRRTLWNQCMPYFNQLTSHVIMTEDIAFSAILLYFSKHIERAQNAVYYYCRHDNNSTSNTNLSLQSFSKRVGDIKCVFAFIKQSLKVAGAKENILYNIRVWEKYYARMYERYITSIAPDDQALALAIIENWCTDRGLRTQSEDECMGMLCTEYSDEFEHLKQRIVRGKESYISFDIFDTVVKRPFWYPEDLFAFLNARFFELTGEHVNFIKMRVQAEKNARKYYYDLHQQHEVTLEQIYRFVREDYKVSQNICEELIKCERELEIHFSGSRKSAKELFDLALLAGKKVIFVSDMYLDVKTVESILHKNGYDGYDALFLSSSEMQMKGTGELYTKVISKLSIKNEDILHIGDNIKSDYEMARNKGLKAYYIPRTIHCFDSVICKSSQMRAESVLVYQIMALTANDFFDHALLGKQYYDEWFYNPLVVGEYVVGMYLIGVVFNVLRQLEENGLKKAVFAVEEDSLIAQALICYNTMLNHRFDFVFAGEKVPLILNCQNKQKLYEKINDYKGLPYPVIIKLFDFCTKETEAGKINQKMKFRDFRCLFFEKIYDEKKHSTMVGRTKEAIQNTLVFMPDKYIYAYEENIGFILTCELDSGVNNYHYLDFGESLQIQHRTTNISLLKAYLFCSTDRLLSGEEREASNLIEKKAFIYQDVYIQSLIQTFALKMVKIHAENFAAFYDTINFIPYSDAENSFIEYFESSKINKKLFSTCFIPTLVDGKKCNIPLLSLLNKGDANRERTEQLVFRGMLKEISKEKKIMVWGTGKISMKLLQQFPELEFEAFIDNDEEKNGSSYYSKSIFHPQNITNWEELYIIIAVKTFSVIESQLSGYGLDKYDSYIDYAKIL